jgi:hypothetical protein
MPSTMIRGSSCGRGRSTGPCRWPRAAWDIPGGSSRTRGSRTMPWREFMPSPRGQNPSFSEWLRPTFGMLNAIIPRMSDKFICVIASSTAIVVSFKPCSMRSDRDRIDPLIGSGRDSSVSFLQFTGLVVRNREAEKQPRPPAVVGPAGVVSFISHGSRDQPGPPGPEVRRESSVEKSV